MPANPHAAAARAEVLERLAAFREARSTVHDDIQRAAELGLSTTEIARAAGMTWHGVNKVLSRITRDAELRSRPLPAPPPPTEQEED